MLFLFVSSAALHVRADLSVIAARGDETVSFARDLAPILARQCTGCHGRDRRRNGLSLADFSSLAKGGDRGPIVNRNDPEKSLLIAKLRGTGPGQRMPLNRPPLSDEIITKFVKWIREGATFDGKNPGQNLSTMAALYRAQHASHSELSQERRELALRNWRLAMPDRPSNQAATAGFLVLGTRSKSSLQDIADAAQHHSATIRRRLRGTAEGPFIKGRMTLFVLDRRYDYVEFGRMVEQRQLPKDWRAHWRYTHLDAYAATVSPPEEETSAGQLVEQLAAVYVASWGDDIPRWFASGVARVVAARIAPRDTRASDWDRQSINQRITVSDFTADRGPPEVAGIIGYRLCKDLMRNGRQFARLTRELKKEQPFAAAWKTTYGVAPEQSVELWMAQRR